MQKQETKKDTKKMKSEKGTDCRKRRRLITLLIVLAVLVISLIVLVITVSPIMTPEGAAQATAISITKTAAHKSGAYLDPDLLIEPLPVENVNGIAVLAGLMVLIVLGIVLREFLVWKKSKEGPHPDRK